MCMSGLQNNYLSSRVMRMMKFLTALEEPELFSSKEIPDWIDLLLLSRPADFLLLLPVLALVSAQLSLLLTLLLLLSLLLILVEAWISSPSEAEEEEDEEEDVEGTGANAENPSVTKAFLTASLTGRARLLPPTRTTSFISYRYRSSSMLSLSPLSSYL